MKILKWIANAIKSVTVYFERTQKEAGKNITGAYSKLDDLGKAIIPIAVNVVEVLKNIIASDTTDVVLKIIEIAIPGTKDDVVIEKVKCWLERELPRLAIKLQMVNTTINLKTPEQKVQAIIDRLKLSDNRGSMALEFAAQLSLYLADGKLTKEELKAAADDYYNTFLKPSMKKTED